MLSQYSWGQFFVFVLVLLVLYYLVVGFLYYRDDFSDLLKGKKVSGGPQLAGAAPGTTAAAPPSLVRPKSAFVATPTATESAAGTAEADATTEAPEAGAAENLPEGAAAVVGGELPDSTARATGRDDSEDDGGPMDAAASVAGATDEAIAADESRQEQEDRPNPQLEALIRRKAHQMPVDNTEAEANGVDKDGASTTAGQERLVEDTNKTDTNAEAKHHAIEVSAIEPEIVYQPAVAGSYEPLADFGEPLAEFEELVATKADVAPVEMEELFAVETVAAFVAQLQAGEQPQGPAALADTTLGKQWALRTKETSNEIASLFA